MKIKTSIVAAIIMGGATLMPLASTAQDAENKFSLKDIDFLIGDWSLETNYANGAKASGTRTCAYALRKTRIRCVTESLFSDGSARDLEVFYSYSASGEKFAEVTVYQRPVGNKVADLMLDKAAGTMVSRGYIYGGDGTNGPRVSEEWTIEDGTISMTMRLNRGSQPAHQWPIFIEETMTRSTNN